jgi:hypothetical protein
MSGGSSICRNSCIDLQGSDDCSDDTAAPTIDPPQTGRSLDIAAPPTTVEGIEKYLGSGMIRGIGPVYAKKLMRAFGETVFGRGSRSALKQTLQRNFSYN